MAEIYNFADAAVLSVCAAFNVLHLRKAALCDTIASDSERDFAIGAINAQQDPMVNRLVSLVASSPAAVVARMQVLALLIENEKDKRGLPSSWWIDLTAAVMRDLKIALPQLPERARTVHPDPPRADEVGFSTQDTDLMAVIIQALLARLAAAEAPH